MHDTLGRILIVDDCALNRKILEKIFAAQYALAFAACGEECLRMVEEFQPHLVLLDIMMPGMDGYEICRQIKTAAGDRFRQVILLSGRGTPRERVRGYENFADDYLVKPFDHDELVAKVRVQFRLWQRYCGTAALAGGC